MIELKSSLGYLWLTLICFLFQIYSHIDNLSKIRQFDASIDEQWKETYLLVSLILVAFTIVASSISTVLNCLHGFGNSLEDFPLDSSPPLEQQGRRRRHRRVSLPWLTLLDIHIALLILLPKLFLDTQLIQGKVKDQSSRPSLSVADEMRGDFL